MLKVARARVLQSVLAAFTLLSTSTAGFAQTPQADASDQAFAVKTASHAVRGVVKWLDASSLVVTRPRGKRGNLTFVLNPSTVRSGTITVGSTVSVRYRKEGNTLIATAVTVHPNPLVAKVF